MATKLGDVWQEYKLDTSQAQRELIKLERRVQSARDRGTLPQKGDVKSGVGVLRQDREKQSYIKQITAAAVKKAGGGLQGSPITSFGNTLTGQVTPFLPPQVAKVAGGAAKVAAAVGIATETVKLLPEAFALGKDIADIRNGPRDVNIEIIERTLDDWRARLVALESRVTSIFEGMKQTVEFTEASRRLTGKLPDTEYYFQQNAQYADMQKQLNAKFDSWKSKEAPFNTAATLYDYFKRGITQ